MRPATVDGIDEAWAVNGPPGLCVMFARLGVFGPIDLVVAGINPGANVGRAIYHSGTVGAALTARNGGISGVAVSQAVAGFGVEGQGWDEMIADQRWDTAAVVAGEVVAAVLAAPLDEPVVVNVNVPNLPLDEIAGWRHATVGLLPPRTVATGHLDPIAGEGGRLRRRDGVGRRAGAARPRPTAAPSSATRSPSRTSAASSPSRGRSWPASTRRWTGCCRGRLLHFRHDRGVDRPFR